MQPISATSTLYNDEVKRNTPSSATSTGINSILASFYAISVSSPSISNYIPGLHNIILGELSNSSTKGSSYQLPKYELWTTEFAQKLQELSTLHKNWDSYGADPPNNIALFWANETLGILLQKSFSPTRVTPSVENGIGISFICDQKYADIECFNEGGILAVTSDGQGNPEVWEVEASIKGLTSAIEKIYAFFQQ